ncbi:MAG: glycosyltransferase family 4 protein [Acidimicrobiia bacterium]|nr:glycosyltransferase family 4 protein [Acidimicrobiia bacterium]
MTSVHLDTARTWRGGQHQVLLTVTGLCEMGHPAVLVAQGSGELTKRTAEGLRTVALNPSGEFDLQAGWQLYRILRSIEPEVVHVHDPMGVALMAMALKFQPRLRPRPLIVASRRVDFHLKKNAFSRWKYRHIDVFIAVSGVIARMLVEDGIPADRIEVVHDGVPIGTIDKTPAADVHKEFWLPHGAPIIGNVAALVPHKGQKDLIAAAAKVVRAVPDARFVILGEGELRPVLEQQVKSLGLERHVFLPGFRPDALSLQKSFDIFVMSSITEGLGSSMLDALACGTPVVGTYAGGIPEAIEHGRTGLLVKSHHPDDLAAAIVRLLKDPALRTRLGAAGRAHVDTAFSVERMVEGTLAVYESRLAARTSQGAEFS